MARKLDKPEGGDGSIRMHRFKAHRIETPRRGPRSGGPTTRHGQAPPAAETAAPTLKLQAAQREPKVAEVGGPQGPEPTRYGDWERKGICYDF